MRFYRYVCVSYGSLDEYDNPYTTEMRLECHEYVLIKETAKGHWIKREWDAGGQDRKWVSKTARRRHAYPTKEEALTNLVRRTQRRIAILEAQLESSRRTLAIAQHKKIPLEVVTNEVAR